MSAVGVAFGPRLRRLVDLLCVYGAHMGGICDVDLVSGICWLIAWSGIGALGSVIGLFCLVAWSGICCVGLVSGLFWGSDPV